MSRKRMSDAALEKGVVGSAMRDAKAFVDLNKIIRRPDVFYSFAHQCLWKALAQMERDGLPFDAVTCYEQVAKNRAAADVTVKYVAELFIDAPATDQCHHAKTLVSLFQKRQIADAVHELEKEIGDDDASPIVLMERTKRTFETLAALSHAVDDLADDEGDRKFVPFPLTQLPESMQDFVMAGAEAMQCDPAFLAVPAIVAVATAIGNSRVMSVKETWQEPCVFWAAIIADSSSRKSPSMDMALSPIAAIQRSISLEFESEYERWKQANDEWAQKRFQKSKASGGDFDERKPEKPKSHQLLVNDITIEKLAHVQWENPHGVCLHRDELSGWFASFGRYADGKGPSADLANWLQIFRAGAMRIDRKGGDPPSFFVPRAAACVVGGVQPKILKKLLTEDFFDSGLVSRLLLAMPKRKGHQWSDAIIDAKVYARYSGAIRQIWESADDIRMHFAGEPKHVGFSKAGKNAWIEFYDHWGDKQTHADGEKAYALSKLEAYCARFCLLLSVFDKTESPHRREEVGEGHVHRAFKLVEWFAHEADRVYAMWSEPADKMAEQRLMEFITAIGGEICPRRLLRSNENKYKTADRATDVLQSLVTKNLGTWVTKKPGPKGGQSVRTFVISPDRT